ncbi:hypothetical protein K7432_017022 [Basidiobolus ranarum]|uniref:Uncharacterized protein n=1 Tax=Basidiobolus ranarum TaxID=34480 RepID=A0ABR2WDX5_9FUNG
MNSLLSLNPLSSRLSIRRPFGRKTPRQLNSTNNSNRPEPSTPTNHFTLEPEQINGELPVPVVPEVSPNSPNRFNFSRMLSGREKETLPSTPESRLEKLLKKAKPFFDERSKPRLRLLALWNLLDLADDLDQAVFFQEHADKIYSAIYNSFIAQTDKSRVFLACGSKRETWNTLWTLKWAKSSRWKATELIC